MWNCFSSCLLRVSNFKMHLENLSHSLVVAHENLVLFCKDQSYKLCGFELVLLVTKNRLHISFNFHSASWIYSYSSFNLTLASCDCQDLWSNYGILSLEFSHLPEYLVFREARILLIDSNCNTLRMLNLTSWESLICIFIEPYIINER